MIGMGSLIGLGAAMFGVAFAKMSNARMVLEVPDEPAQEHSARTELPPLWLAALPVALPLLLIGIDATFTSTLEQTFPALSWLTKNLGDKDMALTLAALAALAPLASSQHRSKAAKAVGTALESGASILLIIAAGGAFGGVLQQTGIAGQLASHFKGIQTFALPLVFIVTTLVRTAQGSATVAMLIHQSGLLRNRHRLRFQALLVDERCRFLDHQPSFRSQRIPNAAYSFTHDGISRGHRTSTHHAGRLDNPTQLNR
jgi:GntP family gluconate:H+ symporter